MYAKSRSGNESPLGLGKESPAGSSSYVETVRLKKEASRMRETEKACADEGIKLPISSALVTTTKKTSNDKNLVSSTQLKIEITRTVLHVDQSYIRRC